MAAITQRISNFLGGVSKQSDDKKLLGQVKECINGYPDVTIGLTKRPGFKFIEKLKNSSGTAYTGTSLDDAKWFYINRDTDTETYIGCITKKPTSGNGSVLVWNAITGAACTVHLDAPNWAASTAYVVGDQVKNDSGKIYTCDTAGTSAGSGGPTGTGSDITDNTARWDYTTTESAATYLTGTSRLNYDVLTVQDTTVITNNLVEITSEAKPTAPPFTTRLVLLLDATPVHTNQLHRIGGNYTSGSDADRYIAKWYKSDGTTATDEFYVPYNDTNGGWTPGSTDWLLNKFAFYLQVSAGQNGFGSATTNGTITCTVVNGTVQVDCVETLGGTAKRKPFALEISNKDIQANWNDTGNGVTVNVLRSGFPANSQLWSKFQNNATTVATLPASSFHNEYAEVTNSSTMDEDNFWVKYVADNEDSGDGYWQETLSPYVSIGLNNTTLPHELINTATNTFTFRPVTYTKRLAGDDITNPFPSFVDKKIEKTFFHSNRLGFLSGDNVIFSQAGEPFNFFHITARTLSDADPIDLSCQTIRPTSLKNILPTAQGLLLFAKNQQFMVYGSEDGILTPNNASTKAISNFELDTSVNPVDSGSYFNFLSKTPGQTRVYSMLTRGMNESPKSLDISQIVSDWIPPNIDTLISSPQSQLLVLANKSSKNLYVFRTFNDGEKSIMNAWVKWQLPGTVQHVNIDNDDMYAVTKQGSNYTISLANLSQSPDQAIIVNNQGQRVNPCVDLYKAASSVVWDSANNRSKCYLPYADDSALTPIIVIAGDTSGGTFADSGFTISPTRGSDGTGAFFSVPGRNLTSVASDVIVGYKYNFDVTLPRIYFQQEPSGGKADYAASLTIARMKFAVGLSGIMGFKLKSKGRSEWYNLDPVINANSYLANDIPIEEHSIFTLPIHQRTENIEVRLFNDSPFPVSLNSMMWEGKYSPRFYRRT